MNILLTGATGFLGSRLAHAFLNDGHHVIALSRPGSNRRRLRDITGDLIFRDALATDTASHFRDAGDIHSVVHCATCYGRTDERASDVLYSNVTYPLRLLEAALDAQTPLFLNTDTFFNSANIEYAYLTTYALSKRHFAEWGRALVTPDRIRFGNLRLEHLYGPDDGPEKFTTWIVAECLRNPATIDLTEGKQRRDFVHIDDVVEAYRLLLSKPDALDPGFQQIGIGCGQPTTIRSFAETAHALTGSTAQLRFGALPYRVNELPSSHADTRRLRRLGWSPRVTLRDGIRSLVDAVRLTHD